MSSPQCGALRHSAGSGACSGWLFRRGAGPVMRRRSSEPASRTCGSPRTALSLLRSVRETLLSSAPVLCVICRRQLECPAEMHRAQLHQHRLVLAAGSRACHVFWLAQIGRSPQQPVDRSARGQQQCAGGLEGSLSGATQRAPVPAPGQPARSATSDTGSHTAAELHSEIDQNLAFDGVHVQKPMLPIAWRVRATDRRH